MAILIDSASNGIYRDANLPSATSFTISGWARIVADVGTGVQQHLFILADVADFSDSVFLLWEGGVGGDGNMYLGTVAAGVAVETTVSSRPAVGIDFHWYTKCSGTGANQLQGGWRAQGTNTYTTAQVTAQTTTGISILCVGGIPSALYANARHWNVKCWDRALSDAEILVESYYQAMKFPASRNFHWPLRNAADTRDLSGNARPPTVVGTLGTADEFGLFAPRRRIFSPNTAKGPHQLSLVNLAAVKRAAHF